jgi:hypothetical protein
MCVFEILHFLPSALIVLSAVSLKGKLGGLFSVMVLVLSGVGLVSGYHSHSEHGAFFGIVDPCFGYVVAIVLSSIASVKNLKNKFARV